MYVTACHKNITRGNILFLIDFILHIDDHIRLLANNFGPWTYAILFAIILVETGAVILPFLPGDSLLFAAGALAANPAMNFNVWIFGFGFFLSALIGDSLNFWVGKTAGYKLLSHRFLGRFIKRDNIIEAEKYFEAKGAQAIILARYIPIVRTFLPFVAGISQFNYREFFKYSFIAAASWAILATGAGYLFGNIPFVKDHFSVIVLGIVFVTLIPTFVGLAKTFLKKRA